MPLDHSITPGERSRALYGADEDLTEFCRCCGEELEDPLESFCPVCRLAGTRAPWPDEGLLNP